jgi:glycogen synthase
LAKKLARQGHAVTVLSPKKDICLEFEKEHHVIIKDSGQPKWKEIELNGKGLIL